MALVPAFTEKPQQQEVRQGILVLVLVQRCHITTHRSALGPLCSLPGQARAGGLGIDPRPLSPLTFPCAEARDLWPVWERAVATQCLHSPRCNCCHLARDYVAMYCTFTL